MPGSLERIGSDSVIEATRRRYANVSTQLSKVESPREVGVSVEVAGIRKWQERTQLAGDILFGGGIAWFGVGSAASFAIGSDPFFISAMATSFASIISGVVLFGKSNSLVIKERRLTDTHVLEVPQNVRDAWRRIRSIREDREDAPAWMVTAAFHADDVLVEISEHHLAGTGDSVVCRELAEAMFVTAARIDAWDLLNSEVADDAETVLPASASLMLEASAPGPHPTAQG